MRVLNVSERDPGFVQLLHAQANADYVYQYPPRQAYRRVDVPALDEAVSRSLASAESLDLYLHFPFCRQICAFCNLYATVGTDNTVFERYANALVTEAAHYAPLVAGKVIDTLYLGGGTPSQMDAEIFARIFRSLERMYGFRVGDVPEVALEMAPDTVTSERLASYVEVGINRVNLGVQTASDNELHGIGRRHGAALSLEAVKTALSAGFRNVCVDLIYGLQGQTYDSWMNSVDAVIALRPPTVCAYALTLRPWTGFAARGYTDVDVAEQTAKYRYVDEALRAVGYRQETHVRWAVGSGGYMQKANHWAMGRILGLGAGARSYLWECDYRNGYSVRHRAGVLRTWYDQVEFIGHGRTDGFLMNDDERRRKAIVLGLHDLDLGAFERRFGVSPLELFAEVFDALLNDDFGTVENDRFRLTASGMRHRDVLVQAFMSAHVRELSASLDYGR